MRSRRCSLVLPRILSLLLAAGALVGGNCPAQANTDGQRWGQLTEVTLPNFQQVTLAKDLPVVDLRFTGDTTLMLLGHTSLWQWRFDARRLRRLDLRPALTAAGDAGNVAWPTPWQSLGFDGLHDYVGGPAGLVEVFWQDNRLFRLPWPKALVPGNFLGFAGQGDDFWLLPTGAVIHFDRYGKTLGQKYLLPFLHGDEHLAFVPESRQLWFTQDRKIQRLDLPSGSQTPTTLLTVKHELLDLQPYGAEMITHTRHTVLRLDRNGKIRHAIPVEGTRQLLAMSITTAAHVYAFDDQMLEVFYPSTLHAERFRLPLEEGEKVAKVRLRGSFVALLVAGQPRLFRLDTTPLKR